MNLRVTHHSEFKLLASKVIETELAPVIAIVDDDPQISQALDLWLKMLGMHTVVHGSAESLMEDICAKEQQSLVRSDVSSLDKRRLKGAVIDLNLPGMTGVELLHRIRSYLPSLPVVLITALSEAERKCYGELPSDVACLRKPFDLDMLGAVLFPRSMD